MALPDQLFYNTGISTYFWIVTNRKSAERRGKVQLIDARELFTKMSKSLGEKRKEISPEQIAEIVRLHGDFTENERVKIFPNESFGFLRITVERPLRLRWEVTEDTLTVLRTHPKIVALPEEVRAALETGLTRWGDEVIMDVRLATKRVVELLVGAGQRGKPLQKAVRSRWPSATRTRRPSATTQATSNPTPNSATTKTSRLMSQSAGVAFSALARNVAAQFTSVRTGRPVAWAARAAAWQSCQHETSPWTAVARG